MRNCSGSLYSALVLSSILMNGCAATRPVEVGAVSSASIAAGKYYVVSGFRSTACADIGSEHVDDTDDNIHRITCNGTTFQQWSISPDPQRPGRLLIEWAGAGNKFWTAEDFEQDADYLTFDQRRDSAFQSWVVVELGNGRVRIKNDGNGRCVDYGAAESSTKAKLRLLHCNTGKAQLWTLQPIP